MQLTANRITLTKAKLVENPEFKDIVTHIKVF